MQAVPIQILHSLINFILVKSGEYIDYRSDFRFTSVMFSTYVNMTNAMFSSQEVVETEIVLPELEEISNSTLPDFTLYPDA